MKIQQGAYPVRRATKQQPVPQSRRSMVVQDYDLEEDDSYYETRLPTSARRYTQPRQQVIQQGNKRLVIHNKPPPGIHMHWSLILGLGMVLMIALWIVGSAAVSWWTNRQLDSIYGMPRTFQTDQVVGHMDSLEHPTHFMAVNLHSHIIITELPGGDAAHARIYSGPILFSENGDTIPVTLEFKDANGDGKPDMIVHIGDQSIVYVNDGTQFKPQA